MNIESEELERIASATLEHYENRAEEFWRGTRHHDVNQNIAALLRHIPEAPATVLDLGCGPGRDLKTFTHLRHIAIGLEGAPSLAAMARSYSGCEVLEQNFLKLKLQPGRFDGVYANASLFHVPGRELPRVLRELRVALKPRGVLFSSNPRGNNEEGWNQGSYVAYWDHATWQGYLIDAGFIELEHYYRPPGLPRAQQPWLATVWRKEGA